MDNTTLTPEESLLLITKIIEETKKRFSENGRIIVFWGILMFVVTMSQFILYRLEYYKIHWYPAFLYPLGAIYMGIHVWREYKKKNVPKTLIGNILGKMGWLLGANLLILGFFFSHKVGDAGAPVFLILLALFIFLAGISIKFKPLIISGIVLNLFAFAAFYVHDHYLYLIMAIGSFALTIPGILLNIHKRKENV